MDTVIISGGVRLGTVSRSIGPYKIAHWIRKNGYTCQVIDFIEHYGLSDMYRMITKYVTNETLVLAISTTFLCNKLYTWQDGTEQRIPEQLVRVILEIKQKFPNLKIVLGGYMSDKLSSWGIADATIMSYTTASEEIFLEYLEHLRYEKQAPHGQLIFPSRSSKPRMMYTAARVPKYNIESDDFLFTEQDNILPGEPLPLDLSRGCIFACKFCQYPHLGKKKLDYIRAMEFVEQEILHNYKCFGTTSYYILDDTFNDTEWKVQEFYNMTQRLPFKIMYSAYIRADLIHRFPDTAYQLKESGLFGAYHGIETFHPQASKTIGKGWSGKQARVYLPQLYYNVWNAEVATHYNFIVGLTNDTKENIESTVDWFIDNDLYTMNFYTLQLFGDNNDKSLYTIQSEFDKNPEKYGYKISTPDQNQIVYWENDNWTTKTAEAFTKHLTERIVHKRKLLSWITLGMLWYGYSKETILSQPAEEYPWDEINSKSRDLYSQYYARIMH